MMAPLYLLLLTIFSSYVLNHLLFKSRHSKLPPGPLGFPVLGNLPQMGRKPHQTLRSLSLVYGPLVHLRFGFVDVVVASSPSVASLFLKTHDANFANRPYSTGVKYLAYDACDIAFGPYGPRWRTLRKIGNIHLFSPKALDLFSHVRHRAVKGLVMGLASAHGTAVEVGSQVNACVADILGQNLVGKRMFVGPSGEREEASKQLREFALEIMKLMGEFVIGDFVPAMKWMDFGGVEKRMKRVKVRFDAFVEKIIEDHVKEGGTESEKDMLSVILELKEAGYGEGGAITDLEIKAFLGDMLIAGTDTSSSTIEWAFSELIGHRDILKKAQQELDTVVGRDRPIVESDIPNLPFLQAIIKETFRLHPPTPLLLPRITSESIEIDGYHIPKNSTILINAWAIGRDAGTWADPLEFRPSRFLPGGEAELTDLKGNDFGLIPFGAGRRVCVGLSLGLRMVQSITATLIHAFDWALPTGQDPEKLSMEESFGLTLQRAEPLKVCPMGRLAPQVYGSD